MYRAAILASLSYSVYGWRMTCYLHLSITHYWADNYSCDGPEKADNVEYEGQFHLSEQEQIDKWFNSVSIMTSYEQYLSCDHLPRAWSETFQLQMSECHLQWTK